MTSSAERTGDPAARVRPYRPTLPRIERGEVLRTRRWLRCMPAFAPDAAARAGAALLGVDVRVAVGSAVAAGGAAASPAATSVLLGRQDATRPTWAVELPAPLRDSVLDRLLGGDGRPAVGAAPAPELVRGVLLFAAARWLEALGAEGWSVVDVVSGSPSAGGRASVREVRVRLGDAPAHALRVWAWPEAEDAPEPGPTVPEWARGLPIPLTVSVASGVLPAAHLAEARAGDRFFPDEIGVRRAGVEGHLEGTATAAVSGSHRAVLSCQLERMGLRIVGWSTATLAPADREGRLAPVKDRDGSTTVSDAPPAIEDLTPLGDAPVRVDVAIASFRLPLEELLALRPGELLATGAATDTAVSLRVGDRVVARGDLVEIDGELGVRITRVGG